MINTDRKTTYSKTEKEAISIYNINDSYKAITHQWLKWLKEKDLGINLFSYRKYYEHLMREHYSPSTINMNLVMMRNRILYLFDDINDSIEDRAALEYRLKMLKAPSLVRRPIDRDKIFTREEVNRLIALSGPRTSLIIEFIYMSGVRRGELCGILKKDCTVKKDGVDIKIFGKGNKVRIVFCTCDLHIRIIKVFRCEKYLFEDTKGQRYDGHDIWTIVHEAGMKILKRSLSPHMLRHSFFTSMVEEGADLKALSQYGGHSEVSTTLNNYVHTAFSRKDALGGKSRR